MSCGQQLVQEAEPTEDRWRRGTPQHKSDRFLVTQPPLRRHRIWPRYGADECSKQFSTSVVLEGESKAKPRLCWIATESRIRTDGEAEGHSGERTRVRQWAEKSFFPCEDGPATTINSAVRCVQGNRKAIYDSVEHSRAEGHIRSRIQSWHPDRQDVARDWRFARADC